MNETEHSPDDEEQRLDAAWAEYLRRRDEGERLDREQWLREHEDLADTLRELLRTAEMVDGMAGPIADEPPSDTARVVSEEQVSGLEETICLGGEPSTRDNRADTFQPEFAQRQFGQYELLEEVGRGGMGVVYKARQRPMDRIVAVKMILSGRLASEADVRRFHHEVQVAGRLRHPHIVGIHEADQLEGQHYYSMPYIEGITLRERAADGQMPLTTVAQLMKSVAEAVQFAHEHGILHRDLKPSNVLLTSEDVPHITDFGLAKRVEDEPGLTRTGEIVGTPSYMSPEQAAGCTEEVGSATDVYALGAVMYYALTGRPPFLSETAVDTLLQVVHQEPVPPSQWRPEVQGDLETICLKCMRSEPRERYASAAAVADDLTRFLEDRPIEARPAGFAERTWNWLRDVPLVAALLGRPVAVATPHHHRAQRITLVAVVIVAVALVAWQWWPRADHVPDPIRLATGIEDGMYHDVGHRMRTHFEETMGHGMSVVASPGSAANLRLLGQGEVDVAILQGTTMFPSGQMWISPLYQEAVHVVVRRNTPGSSFADLGKVSLAIGEPDSGMRTSAELIVQHFRKRLPDLRTPGVSFLKLKVYPDLDGAIVTTGLHNSALHGLLASGEYRLVPFSREEVEILHRQHLAFKVFTIPADVYPECDDIPDTGISTVSTAAFLATRPNASPKMVRLLLEGFFETPHEPFAPEFVSFVEASHWVGPGMHPAAREFFQRKITTPE